MIVAFGSGSRAALARAAIGIALAWLVGGCSGSRDGADDTDLANNGPTQDDPGYDSIRENDGIWDCTYAEVGDQEVVPELGLSAADILEWVEGSRSEAGLWMEPPTDPAVGWTPASGETDVELHLSRGAGSAEQSVDCGPGLRIPMVVNIRTSNGALDESLDASLTATSADFVQISAQVDFEAVSGSLEVTNAPNGWYLVQPTLGVALMPSASAGTLSAIFERSTQDAVMALSQPAVLLRWPADSSCESGVPVPLGADSPDWVGWVGAAAAATWTGSWQDGDAAEVEVAIHPVDELCAFATGSELPAQVTLRTDDGRVDLALEGQFRNDDDQAVFALAEGSRWGGAPAEFVARYGDFGLDLEAYDDVSIQAGFSANANGAEGSWTLTGYANECESVCDENGCSGCPGATPVVLLALDLTASFAD